MPAKRRTKAKAKTKTKPKAKKAARGKTKGRARKAKASVGKAWTPAEIKTLRQTYRSQPASAIAKSLRRSLASVRGKISALGLKKPAKKAASKSKTRRKRR